MYHVCLVPTGAGRGHQFPWGLELQTDASLHVGAGNQTLNQTKPRHSQDLVQDPLSSQLWAAQASSMK